MAKHNVFMQTTSFFSTSEALISSTSKMFSRESDQFIFRHFLKNSYQYSEETSLDHGSRLSLLDESLCDSCSVSREECYYVANRFKYVNLSNAKS